MREYKYIGDTDEWTTKGNVYKVSDDDTFIDETNTECYLGADFEKYFEFIKETKKLSFELMQEYAEFCIKCNIKKLPILCAEDWFNNLNSIK